MNVYTILSAPEITEDLSNRLKQRRLAHNLTQAGLAARSGVPLATLRKFEHSGSISLVSFVRLLVALNEHVGLERLLESNDQDATLDQLLSKPKVRKRGRLA